MYHLFNNKANLYAESRPGYTQSVMDYMTEPYFMIFAFLLM